MTFQASCTVASIPRGQKTRSIGMDASVDVLYEFFLGCQKLDNSLRNLHPTNVSPGPQTVHAMACNTM